MTEGVDFSNPIVPASVIVGAGKRFVVRYLYYPGATKPTLTASEKNSLLSHGLSIALVMEVWNDDWARGYSWGAQLAQWAKSSAAALGLGSLPVYFAVDLDANVGQRSYGPDHRSALTNYFNGVASVIGRDRTGVYGGYYVVEWAMRTGLARWGWQTLAWSYGRLSSQAHIYQYDIHGSISGYPVDLDRSLKTDFGQYPRPSGDYTPPPTKPTIPDTATSYQRITATGDPAPMKYRDLIEGGKVKQLKLRAFKPCRNGSSVGDKVLFRAGPTGKTLNCFGVISKGRLPDSEHKYGDVYLCSVFDDGGSQIGYLKAVDIRFS